MNSVLYLSDAVGPVQPDDTPEKLWGADIPEPMEAFEANGSGVAVNDLNNDGLLDIVLGNHAGQNTILWNDGDLNFRTRYKGQIKSEEQLEEVTQLVEEKNWKELNEADELRMALEKHECLHGFQTLLCK